MANGSGSGVLGWVVILSMLYIIGAFAIQLQAPDTAEDIAFMGDNTFLVIGVIFIAVLFLWAMQKSDEEMDAPAPTTKPAFTETAPPTPPKPTEPAPAPAPAPAPVVEAAVMKEPQVFAFPKKMDGLVGDTMIPVDTQTTVRIRTKLVDASDLV